MATRRECRRDSSAMCHCGLFRCNIGHITHSPTVWHNRNQLFFLNCGKGLGCETKKISTNSVSNLTMAAPLIFIYYICYSIIEAASQDQINWQILAFSPSWPHCLLVTSSSQSGLCHINPYSRVGYMEHYLLHPYERQLHIHVTSAYLKVQPECRAMCNLSVPDSCNSWRKLCDSLERWRCHWAVVEFGYPVPSSSEDKTEWEINLFWYF